MPEPLQPLTISVGEFARLFGIGTTLAYDMVQSGEIPSVRLRRRVLIPMRAVDDLLRGMPHPLHQGDGE